MRRFETGWPVYGALPFILARLKGRVKVVHLYRHPIRVAASLATKNVYSMGAWSDIVAISPSDYGVTQGYLKGNQWDSMSQLTIKECHSLGTPSPLFDKVEESDIKKHKEKLG